MGRWLARVGENATNHNDNNQMFSPVKEKEISKSLKSFLCSHYWSILSHLVSSQRHFFIQSTKTGLPSNTNNIKERMWNQFYLVSFGFPFDYRYYAWNVDKKTLCPQINGWFVFVLDHTVRVFPMSRQSGHINAISVCTLSNAMFDSFW